ncbi:MAG: EVE domain-containing protein [Nitrososphaerota archaeon]
MVNYWIFIVKDHVHMGRIIPASEVLSNRVRNKFWSLSARALNLRRLEKGDKVIFYVTEAERKGFMGRGVLAGPAHPITEEQRFHVIGEPSNAFQYSVDFEEAEMWDEAISPLEIRDRLSFLRSLRNPMRAFRGSIKRISEEDYNEIIKAYEEKRRART